jgi:hypothetical protein
MSSDQHGAISEGFYDLMLALKDALGEVERSAVLWGKEGGTLSREDWARTESVVHAVGDKLRDLKTVRDEPVQLTPGPPTGTVDWTESSLHPKPLTDLVTESMPRPSGPGRAYLITKGPDGDEVDVPF